MYFILLLILFLYQPIRYNNDCAVVSPFFLILSLIGTLIFPSVHTNNTIETEFTTYPPADLLLLIIKSSESFLLFAKTISSNSKYPSDALNSLSLKLFKSSASIYSALKKSINSWYEQVLV